MNRDTHDDIGVADCIGFPQGEFLATVYRADGSIERKVIRNTVTYYGLNRIAGRSISDTGSGAGFIAIGTVTYAGSLSSDVTSLGEVGRKIAAVAVQSREWFAITATWAGNADSLTGVALDAVALCDHVNSGVGIIFNLANGLSVTLQASDFLNLTGRIRVGSHDIGHST